MNKYTQEYKEIAKQLINKSFPSLKNKRIIMKESPMIKKYSAGAYDCLFFFLITINKRVRLFNREERIGLFVHELCHVEQDSKKSFLRNLFEEILYWTPFSLSNRANIERATDILAIKKGYGKNLIAMQERWLLNFKDKKEAQEKIEEMNKNGYLSLEEIKQYMKTHGIK